MSINSSVRHALSSDWVKVSLGERDITIAIEKLAALDRVGIDAYTDT
jgi:hypothetical protein